MMFGEKVNRFYRSLAKEEPAVPAGVHVMNPYREKSVMNTCRIFSEKYFSDENRRIFLFGINPGRFGAGVTGITFTDPVRLEKNCGIANDLDKRQELSSVFVYDMIDRFGGPEKFYLRFFLTAICPLGFTKDGLNMNYYDTRDLEEAVKTFIVKTIREQIAFGCDTSFAACLGEGKNFKFFEKLNREEKFFGRIVPLAHPRFIMQYRLKKKEEFIARYLEVLK
jgi:hypothetical protein